MEDCPCSYPEGIPIGIYIVPILVEYPLEVYIVLILREYPLEIYIVPILREYPLEIYIVLLVLHKYLMQGHCKRMH